MQFAPRKVFVFAIICAVSLGLIASAIAQTNQKENDRQDDSIKIDTNLVTVPVIASDRNDVYTPDLKQQDFSIFEDGVQQEIVFFATVKEPFNVVLMLDTSASASS